MDAFKSAEILRMSNGGNLAWQTFFTENNPLGLTFAEATIKERYNSEVGEEWKERLSAKVEGQDFDKAAFTKQREELQKAAAAKKIGSSAVGSQTNSRSASPALGAAGHRKAQNEAFFAHKGAENATRPADLPPNQGGKYGGFGSEPPAAVNKPSGGVPSADEFQQDPVAALTKGFGWFSAAVTKSAKTVSEAYIAPTAKQVRIARSRYRRC